MIDHSATALQSLETRGAVFGRNVLTGFRVISHLLLAGGEFGALLGIWLGWRGPRGFGKLGGAAGSVVMDYRVRGHFDGANVRDRIDGKGLVIESGHLAVDGLDARAAFAGLFIFGKLLFIMEDAYVAILRGGCGVGHVDGRCELSRVGGRGAGGFSGRRTGRQAAGFALQLGCVLAGGITMEVMENSGTLLGCDGESEEKQHGAGLATSVHKEKCSDLGPSWGFIGKTDNYKDGADEARVTAGFILGEQSVPINAVVLTDAR